METGKDHLIQRCIAIIIIVVALSAVIFTTSCGGGGNAAVANTSSAASSASLSPLSVSVANMPVGVTSAPQSVTLSNSGDGDLEISTIGFTGSNPADFAQTNNCGSSVAAGGTCTINVTFKPSASGKRSADLTLNNNLANSKYHAKISGMGMAPTVSLSVNTLAFTAPAVGNTSAIQSLTLTNSGNADLQLTGISTTGANASDFIETNNCSATVVAGSNCTVNVSFKPSAAGQRAASVVFVDNADDSPESVSLTGVVTSAAVSVTPTALPFGSQTVGVASTPQTITVSNSGNADLSISGITVSGANASDFSQTSNCGATVAGGANCTVAVTFQPGAAGNRTATIAIADSVAGSPQTVSLTGTGAAAIASLSPASVNFGNQSVSSTSAAKVITLSNSGTLSLNLSGISLSGANASDFTETTTCGAKLAAGANCAINVNFNPSATGSRAASILIADDASDSPQAVNLLGVGTAASVSLSPSSLTFANQSVGTSSSKETVSLSNTGNAAFTLTSIAMSGVNASEFAETDNCGSAVAAGSSCTISVSFKPTASGDRSASVVVTDSAAGSPQSVAVSGTGTAAAASVSPLSLAFVAQAVNSPSAVQSVNVTNSGNAALTISSVSISGNNSGDFSQTNNCGSSVAAGDNCTINVTFNPKATGTRKATVTVTDSAAGSPQTISLSGAVATTTASASPSTLSFSSVQVGSGSAAQGITLNNTGAAVLNFTSVSFSGANSGDFSQTNTCGSTVAVGASCTINVSFKPTASGARSATLTFADSATNGPQTIALSGTGSAPVAGISPSTVTFGNQTLNLASAAQAITLSNSGNADLSVSSIVISGTNPGDFSQINNCGSTLAAGGNCSISVVFKPSATGTRNASVSLTDSDAHSPQIVSLSGTGAAAAVSLSVTKLSFGNQPVNSTSFAQSLTLTNTGNAALSIASLTVAGTNAADFTQTNSCGSTVAAGANCTITVTFQPSASGSRTATLNVADSATGSPQAVTLSGTGTAPGLSISPAALTFTNQAVGSSSAAQVVALSNTGNGSLTIDGIILAGTNANDFIQSSTCGSSIAAGANCSISVTFKPSAQGARSAAITLSDNAANSPQSIAVSGTGTQASASLSASTLSFLNQPVSTTSSVQTVTLTNGGNGALSVTGISLSGTNATDFAQTNNCGSSLAAGASCTISLTFTPAATGSRAASVNIANSATPQIVSLTGTGTSASASVSPSSVAFGNQAVSSTSSIQTVTLANNGNASLNVTGVSIGGANSSDFAQTNNCGSSLAAGASCTISLTFTPSAGGSRSAALSIANSATPQSVSLSGTGTAAAISVSPSSIAFGNQAVSATSSSHAVTISNSGNASLTITSIAFAGSNAGDFNETNNCGSSVNAGSSCTVNVTFQPAASGSRSASLTIASSASGPPKSVILSGTGTAASANLSTSSVSFGNQSVGTSSSTRSVTLTNGGNAALSVTGVTVSGLNANDFSQSNNCGSSLAAGANCTINVSFKPSASGVRGAALNVSDSAPGGAQAATLSGTGTSAASNLSNSSLLFGNQAVGSTSGSQPFVLTNSGNASLSIISISVSGSNPGDFAQINNCGTDVAAGANCTINVSFTPAAMGSRSASVNIASSASTQLVNLSGTGTAASASVSPSGVAFGNQAVSSTSSAQTVTLTNNGNASLSVTGISISGINSGDFAQTNNCGSSVAANASCTIGVTFTPAASGSRTASVNIANSATPQSVSLTGTGTSASASVSPSTVAFGNQTVSSTSSAQTVTLTNNGNAALNVTGISISGANSADFAETNNCGGSVAAGANCTISVTFTPAASGSRTASVNIANSASAQSVTLTGTGTSASASVSPSSVAFGNQAMSSTSSAQIVTLTNNGNAALSVTGISISGTNSADFAQTNNCGSSVAAGASCTISVNFTPAASGNRTASVNIANSASAQSVSLTGTGTSASASVSPSTVAFGNQAVSSTSSAQTVTLTNNGNASLSVTGISISGANSSDFAQTNNCGSSVAAGASCTISVTFTPAASGSRAASVSIANSAALQTVSLTGTGTSASASVSPSSVAFGNQAVSSTSSAQIVTLTNNGNAALNVTGISVSGANSSDFAQTNSCGSSVAAGASCTISVTFTPAASGSRTASVSIANSAALQTVSLTGTGTSASASVSPSSVAFGNQTVSSTSSAQTVTLTNNGNASLSVTGISVSGANSGDFAQTNNCGSSVAANASCTISVTFTPAASGSRTASVSIANSAALQTVSLTGTGTSASASVSPSNVVFGNQAVSSTSSAQTVTLTNNGNASLSVTGISLSGANSGDFAQTNNCGGSVAAGASCTISVTFTPAASGSRTASVNIANSASAQSVSLTGTGTAASASLSTSALSFSNQPVSTSSSSKAITLSNSGNAALNVTGISIAGTNAADFTQTNNCGSSVAAGASCTINVTFTPAATGSRLASITVSDNSSDGTQTASLSGTGTAAAVSLSPASVTFGNQTLNASSSAQAIILTNSGTASLNVTSITLSGSNAGDFSQSNNCSGSIAAGASCSINVTFKPSVVGSRAASISVADNATGSPQTVGLTGTGTGTASISVSPSSLTFASLNVGTSSSAQSVIVSNSGTAALTVSGISMTGTNAGDFAQSNNCGSSVAAGASCSISVVFTPSAAGGRSASISIANSVSTQSVTLAGTGASASSAVTLSPTSLSFASEPVLMTSGSQTVTLTNSGSAALNISGFSVTGSSAADFVQNNNCGTTIAVGGNCTIVVLFTPAAAGARSATLSITDNANNSPQSVSLTGTGGHDVVLTWTASTSQNIIGYNVYRGTKAGGESTTPLNSSPISGTTFMDESVSSGTQYYYVVTSVASDGTDQSAASAETVAAVPTP